MQLAKH